MISENEEFYRRIQGFKEGEDEGDMRPDGDADLDDVDVEGMKIAPCGNCGTGLVKPDVVFFGANVEQDVVDECYRMCDDASGLVVAGSSLAVYSSFRFVKFMVKEGKGVMVINVGETRADGMDGVEKVEAPVTQVFEELARRSSSCTF